MKLISLALISVVCCLLSSCDGDDLKYTVIVLTGTHAFGETCAEVFITLSGSKGSSDAQQLRPKNKYGCFFSDKTDYLNITTKIDAGNVSSIRIAADYKREQKRDYWYLRALSLRDHARKYCQWYDCKQWFNVTKKMNISYNFTPSQTTDYKLSVETGDEKDAGTQGKVSITLLGSEGDSHHIDLDQEGIPEFQRGQTYTFDTCSQDIGIVSKIRVELDNTAESSSPNWFLKAVSLQDVKRKLDQWFPWNQWLTPTADQKKISVEIPLSTKQEKQ